MRAFAMGQYGHNNQPVHHILWLLSALDENKPECSGQPGRGTFCPRRFGEDAIHKVLEKAYGLDFFAGDEDNGEMGAWYVLSALGLYEPAPGTKHGYALGSPLFRKVDIYRKARTAGDVPAISIQSHQAGGREARHVSRVLLNGRQVGVGENDLTSLPWTISYDELTGDATGTVLRFVTEEEQESDGPVARVEAPPAQVVHVQAPVVTAPAYVASPKPGAETVKTVTVQDPETQRHLDEALRKVQDQQSKMQHMEALLKTQQQHSQNLQVEHELDHGLASHAQLAFLVLVSVNIVGWLACIVTRRGGTKVSSKSGNSKKSRRAAASDIAV